MVSGFQIIGCMVHKYLPCLDPAQDIVCRRLKAWCLEGYKSEVDSKRHHVFFSVVPSALDAGSDDDLNNKLLRLTNAAAA